MDYNEIILIALAFIIALGFAFFQYLFPSKKRGRQTYVLVILRVLSVFMLLLLLINPKISSISYEIEKPDLFLITDNSGSIAHLGQKDTLRTLLQKLNQNQALRKKFEIIQYNFGRKLKPGIPPDFSEKQTDISSALTSVKELAKGETAVILLSDGNQTTGRDFRYFQRGRNTRIFPVAIGDTTSYRDLELSNLNTNTYAFLNNRFPIEAFISYSGEQEVKSRFVIKTGETIVYSKAFSLDAEKKSTVIRTQLPASRLGILSYEAEIEALEDEKNLTNNNRKFAVEVIDESSNILLLSPISHPDLGTYKKAIESNAQRKLDIKYLKNGIPELSDYQLVMLFQPNRDFAAVFDELEEKKQNFLVITGTHTDWDFLNRNQHFFSKDFTQVPQDYFPVKNQAFNQFQLGAIDVTDFPPLQDKFGTISSSSLESIFFQQIGKVTTTQPLVALTGKGGNKKGFIFGEHIWRWRARTYLENNSFENFDNFISKLIQNLASEKHQERLTVDYQSFYYENEPIKITADFFDQNFHFDPNTSLKISVTNSKEEIVSKLILKNEGYHVNLGTLNPGDYNFTITEAATQISRSGSFQVMAYHIEQQFISANKEDLEFLASNSDSPLYYPENIDELISYLVQQDKFKPVQLTREKTLPLVDWYYLLFLLILILAAEWFYRKYTGLI